MILNLKKISTKAIVAADILLFISVIIMLAFGFNKKLFSNKNKTIHPAEVQAESRRILETCKKNDWHNCYKTEFSELTKNFGFLFAEQTLLAVQDVDGNTRNCHVIAHFMSREAYRRDPGKFDELLLTLNVNACGSGFLHGVLEAYMGKHPEIEVNGPFADEICSKGSDPYWQRMCAHFMGHIFLVDQYGDLEAALPACDTIKPEWQFDCYNGLFMEDHQKLALAEHDISPLPVLTESYMKSMEETCLKYDSQKAQACWTEMAEMYAHAYGYDPEIIHQNCGKAPTDEYRRACYSKSIVVTAVYSGFDTAEKLTGICKFYARTKNDYQWCTSTIISAFMYYSPKYTSRAITLCGALRASDEEWCFQDLGAQLKKFVASASERHSLCQGAVGKFHNYCVNE